MRDPVMRKDWEAPSEMKVDLYRKLFQLDPSSQVFVALAEELCSQSAWDETIAVCRQGLTFHPENLRGRVLLGWALWESGVRAEGEKILQEASEDLEKNAVLYRVLAEAAQGRGDSERSTRMMALYHALQPGTNRSAPTTIPSEPPETLTLPAHALDKPVNEAEAMGLELAREPIEEAIGEVATEMPAVNTEGAARDPFMEKLCKLLEQYTCRPRQELADSVLFARKDREALKKILSYRTA